MAEVFAPTVNAVAPIGWTIPADTRVAIFLTGDPGGADLAVRVAQVDGGVVTVTSSLDRENKAASYGPFSAETVLQFSKPATKTAVGVRITGGTVVA